MRFIGCKRYKQRRRRRAALAGALRRHDDDDDDDDAVAPGEARYGAKSAASPTLTSIAPTHGTVAGGTTVTVAGTSFDSGAAVTINGAPCTNVVRVSSTELTAVTPAEPPAPATSS